MEKDKLIAEYTGLCVEYVNFTGPEAIDKKEYDRVVSRIKEIRKLLELEPIDIK